MKLVAYPMNGLLLLVYITALYVMDISPFFNWDFFTTGSYIIALVFWGYIHVSQQKKGECSPFNHDFYLISITIVICYLCSLIIEGNNPNVRAWWALGLAIIGFAGIAYALIYSTICLLLPKEHKLYTMLFGGFLIGV